MLLKLAIQGARLAADWCVHRPRTPRRPHQRARQAATGLQSAFAALVPVVVVEPRTHPTAGQSIGFYMLMCDVNREAFGCRIYDREVVVSIPG